MRIYMIGFASLVAGSATAVIAHHIHENTIAQQQMHQDMMQSLYATPLQQVPHPVAAPPLPDGMLPLDASPTPGYTPQPGSAMPGIQIKPGMGMPAIPKGSKATLILVRTDQTIKETKDPIWSLQLKVGNQIVTSIPALTGRFNKQQANRHQAGNKSPLPTGTYTIDRVGIERGPFDDPELGTGYWIPITPQFRTARSALGFHQDPSWGRKNGESGTSGCIGLDSAQSTALLVAWIKHYNIRELIVQS